MTKLGDCNTKFSIIIYFGLREEKRFASTDKEKFTLNTIKVKKEKFARLLVF